MIVGEYREGNQPALIQQDWKRVGRVTVPVATRIVKVKVLLDGLGSAPGDVTMKAVVYTAAGELVVESTELVIAKNTPLHWAEFSFIDSGQEDRSYYFYGLSMGKAYVPPGDYDIGIHAAGPANAARVWEFSGGGATGKFEADVYADGTSLTMGAGTVDADRLCAFIEGFVMPEVPVAPDGHYATYPFRLAQSILGIGSGTARTGRRRVDAGMYSGSTGPRGSFALVRAGSELEELVGERVRVTVGNQPATRSVVVLVWDSVSELDQEMALARRAFLALATLSEESIRTTLEVVEGDA